MPSDPAAANGTDEVSSAQTSRLDRALVEQIIMAATSAPARLGDTRLVSIDGPAGSGKTTASAALLDACAQLGLAATVLHADDLYEGWDGLRPSRYPGFERRLLDQVLLPLAAGLDACWQRYDWVAGAFDDWVALPPPEVLIFEGCGSGALAYSAYISALVWVEAGRDTRIARGRERDGDQVLPDWVRWMASEQAHFDLNATRGRADLVVRTD